MMTETIDLLDKNPMTIFCSWFEEASQHSDTKTADVLSFATSSKTGRPSVRNVKMSQICDRGLKIYTNYDSGKGKNLDENPNCSLAFAWSYKGATFWKQVIISGKAEKLERIECLEQFKSLPLSLQIRAQFHQNEAVNHPADVTGIKFALSCRGGYLIIPEEYTFFSSRLDGINLRVRFIRQDHNNDIELCHFGAEGWVYQHLYP